MGRLNSGELHGRDGIQDRMNEKTHRQGIFLNENNHPSDPWNRIAAEPGCPPQRVPTCLAGTPTNPPEGAEWHRRHPTGPTLRLRLVLVEAVDGPGAPLCLSRNRRGAVKHRRPGTSWHPIARATDA